MVHNVLSNAFGAERTSVRLWVSAWQLRSIDGITWKNAPIIPNADLLLPGVFPGEEFLIYEVAVRFNISNETVVRF